MMDEILKAIAKSGDDGVTTKELVIAQGQLPTPRRRERMLIHLNAMKAAGTIIVGEGWRPDIRGQMVKVTVFRPVTP